MSIVGTALRMGGGKPGKAIAGTAKATTSTAQTASKGKGQLEEAKTGAKTPTLNKKKGTNVSAPKPPQPGKANQPDLSKVSHRVHQTYDDMIELEKRASGDSLGKTIGRGAALTAGGALATAGVTGAIRGASNLKRKMDTEKTWKRLKKRRPELTGTPKARENFETLQKFSPDIASDINTLETYMERVDKQNMMPHEFIGDLTNTQDTLTRDAMSRSVERNIGDSIDAGINEVSYGIGKTSSLKEDKGWVGEFKGSTAKEEKKDFDNIDRINQYVEKPKSQFEKKEIPNYSRLKEAMQKVDPR